ncbi:TPA: mannitol dehydrogenase family protein [Burkholderia territorii]|uniref:mannitol dehydrogenase family protein n=1 Tax=Burkholderia territorii TaxID=1503055 RepID=UPI0011C867CD|nr:mannitol dehydrogenase family protein [Burkholderia territorii]TXG03390.1 mannitol dehydrogenase family protein [Burkholderia territorii]HDR8860043.1 mannitol dehydrogenase family protein [Burkholderia territorii]HDR8865058.1 mannitol dehydrogenase family protein [Burkholderia territorii]HDR8872551.1 mannitol dehydrogenase family protein [Burkholderia territorii]HDR8878914.1 mannitol dehydrogenase family protein [Burkholderia territorii]
MTPPILQFGTSRFLLAHVDLFVSQALDEGSAMGGIGIVQTTGNPASRARIDALRANGRYPVRIRGRDRGVVVDEVVECRAVQRAWDAGTDWAEIRRAVIETVRVIVSNTGDAGYRADPRDAADLLAETTRAPHGFPAKLLVLLYARWQARPDDGVSILPCELVANNGDTLRDIVLDLAQRWRVPDAFAGYLRERCIWVNSLVDRIVSEPIDPVGAVAEPYALWAIERRAGIALPCRHAQIVVTDDLRSHERLKLFFLNLGHSWLAEQWLAAGRPDSETVRDAMNDTRLRDGLEAVWRDEVAPVFAALGLRETAERYVDSVRERFLNPYLAHRLADIANNHREKIARRIEPLLALADSLAVPAEQPRLRQIVARHGRAADATTGRIAS